MINADFNPITDNDFRGLGRAEHHSAVINDAGQASFPTPPPEETAIQHEQTSGKERSLNFSKFKTSPCSTQLSAAGKSRSVPKLLQFFPFQKISFPQRLPGSYASEETMETRAWSLLF